ncbi:hypothetical protein B5X24_HaOG214876, partial [Helicoverpa armigera]
IATSRLRETKQHAVGGQRDTAELSWLRESSTLIWKTPTRGKCSCPFYPDSKMYPVRLKIVNSVSASAIYKIKQLDVVFAKNGWSIVFNF